MTKPSFNELPLAKDGPPGNAWGLFGNLDDLGMLNLITPAVTAAAASEIKHGTRVPLDWPLDMMAEPCFGRVPFKQEIKNKAPRSVNDDSLAFNTQSSSQWDGFRHYGYQKEKRWFNGRTLDDILNTKALGTHAWVENGGIVSRGILLDYASWAEKQGIRVDCFQTTSIPVSILQQVAASQNVQPRPGDILLVRTAWTKQYEAMTQEQRRALAGMTCPPAIGVESSEETLRWLWECGFAAVAGDMPSFEAWPCQDSEFWLHEWLLAGWGMPIGELFDLERLSGECKKNNRWSFFFSSMPLYVPGGVASPPNAVAVF